MRRAMSLLVGASLVVLAACGDSTPAGTGTGTCTPGITASVGITAAGVSPKAVCVRPAGTVTFTNGTAVEHEIEVESPCSATNGGTIAAGATRTLTVPVEQVCTFRDPTVTGTAAANFTGTVGVSTVVVGGAGY
jgi:plastocyanin